MRGGGAPEYFAKYIGWLIHSPSASSIDTPTRVPRPVFARSSSAMSVPEYAYMPAAMSAIETPARDGVSAEPVTDSSPLSAWTSRSYALRSDIGPPSP